MRVFRFFLPNRISQNAVSGWVVGVIVPVVFLLALVWLISSNPRSMLEAQIVLGQQRLPLLPLTLIPATLVGLASFMAHFSRAIPNWMAWLTILLCAALTIYTFALLNQAAYVYCTAPNCAGSELFALEKNGQLTRVSNGMLVSDDSTIVTLDNSFRTALYFAIVTFTTLGYGDMQPSPDFRLYAAYSAILGYLYLSLIVGAVIEWGTRTEKAREAPVEGLSDAIDILQDTVSTLKNQNKSAQNLEAELRITNGHLTTLRAQFFDLRNRAISGKSRLR